MFDGEGEQRIHHLPLRLPLLQFLVRQRGRWLEQVAWQDVEAAAEDNGKAIDLRIVTRGDRATLFFNGAEFAEFDGVPPNNGQQVGILVASPESGTARFAFDDFRVTRP